MAAAPRNAHTQAYTTLTQHAPNQFAYESSHPPVPGGEIPLTNDTISFYPKKNEKEKPFLICRVTHSPGYATLGQLNRQGERGARRASMAMGVPRRAGSEEGGVPTLIFNMPAQKLMQMKSRCCAALE